MAILKDLIVHGSSRFLNKIYASEIQTPLIEAEAGIFKKLKADDATVVGLLDVKGQLHTNSWSNSNIATIDGSFYITPTIGSASGTVAITASSLTFSGTNYAISSLYLGDGSSLTWPQYSKVLVTGQILSNGEWIPLGTLLGQLSSTATAASISINNIKDNKNQTSNVLTTLVNEGTISSDYRNLKVSLYQRASSSTAFYPLGIYITAVGDNGRTFLDIYGGVNLLNTTSSNYGGLAEPNVRIGNLQGLPNVGGQSPNGWGIYTDNGYFKGIIAADRGYIGTGSKYWVIGNYEDGSNSNNDRSYIYNGTNSTTSTIEGVYLGTDGIRNYKDSTHYVTIKNGVISALGVDLSGKIIATSGTIGGASITNGTLIVSNANISDINASKINTGDIAAARIQTNLISAIDAEVNDLSALIATIGGFQIDSSSVHTKSVAITSNADNSIALSSADFTRTINSTSRAGLRFAIGDKFGVTGDGTIYASNVDLTGKIIATSGTIGGIEIENGALKVSSINIGNLEGASNYAQKTDVTQAIDNIEADIEDAKKVATNYLSIDNTGIMVANMKDGEQKPNEATGRNVFIDNDSVDIRNGTLTLASFTGDNTKFYDPVYQKELATFGTSGAIIGANNEQRFVIEKDSVSAINENGALVFSIASTNKTFKTEAEAAPAGEVDAIESGSTITLDVGDSVSEKTFYIKNIRVIIAIYNSSSVLNNVKVNSVNADATRFYFYNGSDDYPYSQHSIIIPESPAFSCNYGASKTVTYEITANFTNDYNDSYNLTCNFTLTYNGERTLNLSILEGSCTRTSGNNGGEASFDTYFDDFGSKYTYTPVISSAAYTKAPSMTFGTRIGEDGMLSSVFGQGLYAEKDGEFVIGRFNEQELQTESKYAFVVGNGQTEEHRSNALTIDWSGNICFGVNVAGSETDAELVTAIENAGWDDDVYDD